MATGPRYVVGFKRKRQEKTDYQKRRELLKSRKTRLVVRESNRHVRVQLVDYKADGDVILASAHSQELKKFGWKYATSNTPAAYLTGFLCGMRVKSKGVKDAILDLGLYKSTKERRLYAAMKGACDAGVSVPHDEKIIPSPERIKGEHIAKHFSDKKDITKNFDEIKSKIESQK